MYVRKRNDADMHADIDTMHAELTESFRCKALVSYKKRVAVLKSLRAAIIANMDAGVAALAKDLHRDEATAKGEIYTCVTEIDFQLGNLAKWMKPEPRATHMLMTPGHTEVRREPYGVVLVIGPFNYPINLSLVPAIGALAAGNCIVVKPSEQTIATQDWLMECVAPMVDRSVCRMVAADIPRTTKLLYVLNIAELPCGNIFLANDYLWFASQWRTAYRSLKWDFIFFTGSPGVGRIVSKAAAEHLTPTVMELGGKAPVILDQSVVHVGEAARRVAWGKWINSGQTCIAPDYVLCHRSKYVEFMEKLVKAQNDFYEGDPSTSEDYARMCTEQHAERAVKLLKTSISKDNSKIICGGPDDSNSSTRYVPPTIVDLGEKGASDPSSCALLGSEMFNPILSVVPFDDAEEAISIVNKVDPQPLALYVFVGSNNVAEKYLNGIQSGDAMINDTFMHQINPTVPFGGIGGSGHGTYRGRYSFETFTYPRGILFRHALFDVDQTLPFNVRYPPSGKARKLILPHALQLLPMVPRIFKFRLPSSSIIVAITAAAIAFASITHGAALAQQSRVDFLLEALNAWYLAWAT